MKPTASARVLVSRRQVVSCLCTFRVKVRRSSLRSRALHLTALPVMPMPTVMLLAAVSTPRFAYKSG